MNKISYLYDEDGGMVSCPSDYCVHFVNSLCIIDRKSGNHLHVMDEYILYVTRFMRDLAENIVWDINSDSDSAHEEAVEH